jgi:Gluconate 2-dehydrogenase subunit 3
MSERQEESRARISRRDLGRIAALALAGPLEFAAAQHVHQELAADSKIDGDDYKPKALTQHEFDTLKQLCEMIVPGASKGGAAEFADILSSQNIDMLTTYTGGLAWLNEAMLREYSSDFLTAKPDERTAMLDRIAYRRNETPELAAGIRFFAWTRRMSIDAYYTSAAGIKEIGYMGNRAVVKFEVPKEAIDYAVKRSGL